MALQAAQSVPETANWGQAQHPFVAMVGSTKCSKNVNPVHQTQRLAIMALQAAQSVPETVNWGRAQHPFAAMVGSTKCSKSVNPAHQTQSVRMVIPRV